MVGLRSLRYHIRRGSNGDDDTRPRRVGPPQASRSAYSRALSSVQSSTGTTPSLFAQSVRYPLTADDRTYLRQFVEQASQQGALPS
ncbi:MAG: hypothetical protein JWR55_2931 [Aeromicrobium sp.]|nr:hypothetical protein [Aeromicrobium sp.]